MTKLHVRRLLIAGVEIVRLQGLVSYENLVSWPPRQCRLAEHAGLMH